MPAVEISAMLIFGVVAIGNYVEAWKQTSTKHRTRVAFHEMSAYYAKLQALEGYLKLFDKYQRHLTKEESGEYERLKQGKKWIRTVRPRLTNVPLPELEEKAADAKAFVGSVEHFVEPYQKAVIGYSSAEVVSLFEHQLPFSKINFETEQPWGTLRRAEDECFDLTLKEYTTC